MKTLQIIKVSTAATELTTPLVLPSFSLFQFLGFSQSYYQINREIESSHSLLYSSTNLNITLQIAV